MAYKYMPLAKLCHVIYAILELAIVPQALVTVQHLIFKTFWFINEQVFLPANLR